MTAEKSNMLHAYYYTRLMGKKRVRVAPPQPKAEDRLFLRHAPKPPLVPTPTIESFDENGEPYSIGLEVHPIEKVIPRAPIDDINFGSLQIWLDNLGQAIYNPLFVIQTPDGEFHSNRDGNHRSRCLWEIGEPEIRLIVRHASDTQLKGMKRRDWLQWLKKFQPLNDYPTAKPYFFGLPRKKWMRHYRRYYPPLWKPSPVLEGYFNEPTNDGRYFRDTLFNGWTFREIYSQWTQTAYRLKIVDTILEHVDVENKKMLDVGAYYGWADFMLLEEGLANATALEQNLHRCQVMQHIAAVRAYPLKVINSLIQKTTQLPNYDIILLLNVFHHILHQTETAWDILNMLIQKCDVMFFMMGPKINWGILKEYNNDVELALRSNVVDATITKLYTTKYRNRILFKIEKKTN